jgi:hypothetical protein
MDSPLARRRRGRHDRRGGSEGEGPHRAARATHRSLTGHSKMSRMVARLIPFYESDISDFFHSDGVRKQATSQ